MSGPGPSEPARSRPRRGGGWRAAYRFLELFSAQIWNPHTRRAYVRAVGAFCARLDARSLPSITAVSSIHVAAYVEALGRRHTAPTVKQHLAAIRKLFDWLATGGVLPFNPATAVRGPRHVIKRGKTPVLAPDEEQASLIRRLGVALPLVEAVREHRQQAIHGLVHRRAPRHALFA